ncbi:Peroxiredoxin family protein/glutaredoxin [hydrothermal vent metagenome]|uniref:Peroxiredoxin family protein/glutaredoxin n=1 Tax=hydrothermal vent metagenome TaxID=652676 RepID=A0A3B1AJZ4_9ZZZZ
MFQDQTGKTVPNVIFHQQVNDEWQDLPSSEIFNNKTVVVFSLPGAFTPTCSANHVPQYNKLAPSFYDNGVDEIVCVSVNDTFVMNAWKQDQNANNIRFIPDGNAEFTQEMSMLVDKDGLGFGKRSWRYSMLVKNGVIDKMFIEADVEGDPFEVSDADTMLDYINPLAVPPKNISLFTRAGCGYCAKAKALLDSKQLHYETIELNKDISETSLQAITKSDSVPQIFIDGEHIGDSEDLAEYLNSQIAS